MPLYDRDGSGREPPDAISHVGDGQATGRSGRDLRVVHVAQTIAGGIASYFEEIAAYQSEAFGAGNVSFLVPAGSEVHLPCVDPAQIVSFSPAGRRPGALLSLGHAARQIIRRLRPDVLHLHSSFAGAVVRTVLRGRNRPRIIYCPHGWSFAMEASTPAKLAYAAVERQLARRTDLILVNSVSEYELAVRFGLPAHKLSIVHNGIAWAPAPRRRQRGGELRLAFIGRHDRQKGLDILLDAISRFELSHMQFHIVGESVVGRTASRDAPTGSNLIYHGWLSRAETLELLHDVDAVVMPSRWEAFGLVAVEAMRAGVAVIGSNRGALPEIIGNCGYVFDIDDAEALGRLLERLDAGELCRLGASARARWESEYVSGRMNEQTREAYERVLSAPAGSRASPVPGHSAATAPAACEVS